MSQPSSYSPTLGAPRALPRYLPLARGESFRSYVERLAVFYKLMLAEMISRLGMAPSTDPRALTGFGIVLSEKWIAEFARTTRISEEAVRGTLLSAYDGIAIDLSGIDFEDPQSIVRIASREWAYLSGSHYCPICLAESKGAWKLAWKLPWSYCCIEHSCLLEDTCPGCGQRAGRGRTDRSLSPAFHARVPALCRCANPLPTGSARKGKASAPCGYDLSAVTPLSIAGNDDLLGNQRSLNRMLALDGVERSVAQSTFNELRSVAALILYAAATPDLGALPEAIREEFDTYAIDRDRRRSARTQSEDRRSGAHARTYIGAPQSAKRMAAVVPLAQRIVHSSGDELTEELRPLVARVNEVSNDFRWQVVDYFKFSERLRKGMEVLLASRGTFDRRAGARSHHAKGSGATYAFASANIPQCLPEAMFRAAAGLFTGILEYQARRFCSMALVKLLGGTWADAAQALDLPPAMNRMANKVITTLNANGTYDQFVALLHGWAREYSEQQSRPDFAALRRTFAAFTDFPPEDWANLCAEACIRIGEPGGRSRYAAAWWWADITQGDWRLAPSMIAAKKVANAREVFRALEKAVFPKLSNTLRKYRPKIL